MTEEGLAVARYVKNLNHASDYSAAETAIHDKLAITPDVVKLGHAVTPVVAKLNRASIAQCTIVSLVPILLSLIGTKPELIFNSVCIKITFLR